MAIRVVQYEDWERARDLRLRALADAPDAFARSLEEEERLSESEWRDFVSPSDSRVWFVEATDDDELVGMASAFWTTQRRLPTSAVCGSSREADAPGLARDSSRASSSGRAHGEPFESNWR